MASRYLLGRCIRRAFLPSAARFPPPVAGLNLPSSLLARFGPVGRLSTEAGHDHHPGGATAGYGDRFWGWWYEIGEIVTFWSLYLYAVGSWNYTLYKQRKWVPNELNQIIIGDEVKIMMLEEQLDMLKKYS